MTTEELVLENPRPGVVLLRIDRPPANALTYELRLRILDVWRQLRDDDAVRAIVVTGAGDRFFSAGLDLREVASWQHDPETMHERIDLLRWDPEAADLWKPIIGAINGYCLAGGWHLAEMCDVRIAADRASFGISEGRWGLPALFAWSLARRMPPNLALEALLFPDRKFSAERMFQLGWLNAVVPLEELLTVALDWATEVASLPADALAAHKKLLRSSTAADEALRAEAEATVRRLYDNATAGAGIAEFLSQHDTREGVPKWRA